ncbi:dienelactone hydrolase family protein [Consotaella aegiceratis]|uniref:dienelactone hydrolase family protein n=1 Tax=Consotaella aegiceratis TaxID=3097961 RepID=UPI002F41FB61
MPQVERRDVEYTHEGIRMLGVFCSSAGGAPDKRPGVFVVHGAHGLGTHTLSCAERIAALGYAVLAVDLWGDRRLLTDPSEIGPTLCRFVDDRAMWMGRLNAAHAALAAQPEVDAGRIGAVGYCFGGTSVLEFIRTGHRLAGAVSFHGGLDMVADDWSAAKAGGKALILSGADDPMAKPGDLARLQPVMTEAGIDWEVDLYSHTKHAFTEPDRPNAPPFTAYNERADRRSWQATRGFFEDVFAD